MSNLKELADKFAKMGARLKVNAVDGSDSLRIDVQRDHRGEYFEIDTSIPLHVLDIDQKNKHLVLMACQTTGEKPKFLCGFDERGWFAAALPETGAGVRDSRRGISSVESAKDALKPKDVREAEKNRKIKPKHKNKRRNKAWKRQGEWFFVPAGRLQVDENTILKNEPIRMGNRRQHVCAEIYRTGGEQVWVSRKYPNGLTDADYKALPSKEQIGFRRMTRDAKVYARGRITAPDHAPLYLDGWHEVMPNTESRARHGAKVAFLD